MTARSFAERFFLEDISLRLALVLAVMIGATTAIYVFGLGYVTGTSDFWNYPVGDAEMMVTGWNYFVHDAWHWPLALTKMTQAPRGLNILFLDSIPLVSFVSKIVGSLTGMTKNPFGPWHLVLYILQCVFAVLIGRQLGLRSLSSAIGLALLCVSMHVFVGRRFKARSFRTCPDPALQEATGAQWDGHNFLGFGVLGLLVLGLLCGGKSSVGILRRHGVLVVASRAIRTLCAVESMVFGDASPLRLPNPAFALSGGGELPCDREVLLACRVRVGVLRGCPCW